MVYNPFNINYDFEELEEFWKQFDNSEDVINEVFWGTGAKTITKEITEILPESGRTWKGKAKAAKSAKPFQQKNGNLQVTIKAKKKWSYLYFPDDGSNTIHHFGNQNFMLGGAEKSQEEIVDEILDKLLRS